MEGIFITFEGNEGSGKSTQIQLLSKRIAETGREVVLVREPGGTPLGEEIRDLIKHKPAGRNITAEAELLLLNAARAQLVRAVIRPALERKAIVLCDGFHDSSIAYQGFGRGLPIREVERVLEVAVGDVAPHLTLLLDISLDLSEERRAARQALAGAPAEDHFESEGRAFFEKVDAGYRAIAQSGGLRVRTVDAAQPVEKVAAEIWRWVEQLLETPMAPGAREYKSIGEYQKEGPG